MVVVTLVYATGGREFWMLAWVVDMASRVVTPSATRAGTALWSSQKESQDTDTVIEHGMYTCTSGISGGTQESWTFGILESLTTHLSTGCLYRQPLIMDW